MAVAGSPGMVGLCLLVPSYYADPARCDRPQPLREKIKRLQPYEPLIADHDTRFLVGDRPYEVLYYLGHILCKTYETGDAEAKKMMRAIAELSVRR